MLDNESLFSSVQRLALEFKSNFFSIIPNLLEAIVILVLGTLFAYLLKWACDLIAKWGLYFIPKALIKRDVVKTIFRGLALGLGKVLFFVTIFLSINASLKKMGFLIVSQWMENFSKYIPNIIGALLIIYIGWKAKEFLSSFLRGTLKKANFEQYELAVKVLSWSVFLVSFPVALEQIGIDMSLVVTISTALIVVTTGGVMLTFALGAKSTITDILCCYQLNRFIKIGNQVEISGFKGVVKEIGPTFVLIQTELGDVTIPGNLFNREMTLVSRRSGAKS